MAEPNEPEQDEPQRNRLVSWVHENQRQAILLGFVAILLLFATVRGFISDNPSLEERTETAKKRWALIQTSQEDYYAANGHYAASAELLEGAVEALKAPDETLLLAIELDDDGTRVEMHLTGTTILLSRTLAGGEETNSSCLIRVGRAGKC